jgi:hypothetical protein
MATQITNHCNICNKKIRRQEKTVKCTLCFHYTHNNCLPTYTVNDILYASDISNLWTCPQCLTHIFPFSIIENNSSIIEACCNPINSTLDLDSLNNLVYDPFDTTDNDGEGFFNDIDPDQNFLAEFRGTVTKQCKYYYSSKLLEEIAIKLPKSEIALIHLNIRSSPKNLITLIPTLHASNINFNIIALSETWLNPGNADCYGIQDFSHEYLTRGDKVGGGVSLYINDRWNYKIRTDLNHNDNDI